MTGGTYSPIDIIAKYAPGAAVVFFGLIFAFMATASTNLTGDVPAATNAVIRITRLGWVKSLIIATLLAWLLIGPYSMVNWKQSLDVANYLTDFNWYYSMWLGPIAGIMVVDFWVTRKKEYDMNELYNPTPQSKYWYSGGINWIGVGSFLIGIVGEYVISWARGTLQILLWDTCARGGAGLVLRLLHFAVPLLAAGTCLQEIRRSRESQIKTKLFFNL